MAYMVSARDEPSIDFAPATLAEEIVQNVRTILTTIKYEIPLDRGFGIDGGVVDMPIQQAEAFLSNEIFQQIKKYEPRAIIKNIAFEGDSNGKLSPTVEVSVSEA